MCARKLLMLLGVVVVVLSIVGMPSAIAQESGLAAPDGKWLALIARHIYGPEDVLVVSTK
jgi:hypothetical protein